jgi:uncharacterized membrane protein
MMNKIVALIFPEKANADVANLAFEKFGAEGIEVYALTIISRNSDGRLSVLEHTYDGSHVTAVAAMIGGLAGLPGGLLAVLAGAVGGALIGLSAEFIEKSERTNLVEIISDKLAPGDAAVVADIAEEELSHFEARMSAQGGILLRQS